jgi:DNA-binding NarL/FixJ family response regulator
MIPHILIVESDNAAAQVTSAILARAVPTAIVSVESDFAAAQRGIQSYAPDVLIVDPVLHRPESIELVRHLKIANPHARIIVIASTPTPALRREMESLGVDTYIEKPALLPLRIQQLLAMVPAPLGALGASEAVHSHDQEVPNEHDFGAVGRLAAC